MGEIAVRVLLFLAGLACVACEVWGSYDFMMEKYGHWNYLVAGSLVLTALAAILPIGAEYAHRQGMRALKWAAWLAVPLAVAFVFTVSIQRTGTATDTDEAARKQASLAITIAKKEEAEAEAQLAKDQKAIDAICGVWGPKCTQAKEDRRATELKLANARAALKKHGVVADDSMARRIVAYLPFLSREQVQLYQPLLLPLGLAIIGSLLIAIGARRRQPEAPRPAGAAANDDMPQEEPAAAAPPVEKTASSAEKKPPPARLVVDNAVPRILTQLLEKAPGKRTYIEDVYAAYVAQCQAEGKQAAARPQFAAAARLFCEKVGIETKAGKGRPYMLGVQLVANMPQTHLNTG